MQKIITRKNTDFPTSLAGGATARLVGTYFVFCFFVFLHLHLPKLGIYQNAFFVSTKLWYQPLGPRVAQRGVEARRVHTVHMSFTYQRWYSSINVGTSKVPYKQYSFDFNHSPSYSE